MGEFSLNGPGMKAVRQSVSRLQRRGYTTRVLRHATLTAGGLRRARRGGRRSGAATAATSAASRWRSAGWATRSTATASWSQARDGDGRLRGFLSFVPWGRTGLSLDLMRRDPTADNGLVELMVASLAEPGRDVRRRAGLAQLRDVPRGLRARRRDRRRAGRPAVAAGPAAGQQELAAGVALPLQREVPARVAAALHVLRVRLRPAARRHGRRQRRGLPDRARRSRCSAARASAARDRSTPAARSTRPRSSP